MSDGRAGCWSLPLLAALWGAAACSGASVPHAESPDASAAPLVPHALVASPAAPSLPADGPDAASLGSETTVAGASSSEGPPYPIVLAHGFFGFERFAGADFATYFYRVRERLAEAGETLVFTPSVDPFNDSAHRGAELLLAIERIRQQTGKERVNIVAHSQGGLDARYVASVRPEWVASVLTISTPHRGTPIAAWVLEAVDHRAVSPLVDALGRLLGRPFYEAIDEDSSLLRALRQLSPEGARRFAERYPDHPERVRYFSVAGASGQSLDTEACRPDSGAPAFVARWSRERDAIDPLLAVTERALRASMLGEGHPNDGMVRVEDARHGRFLGCIPADHLDEVGHLLGDDPGGGNRFDYAAFYVELVRWLRAQGL